MKRILSLVALVLCMVMLFCSCGLSFINKNAEVTPRAYDNYSAKELSALDGFTVRDSNDTCVLLSKTQENGDTDYHVYNYIQDTTVYTETIAVTDTSSVSISLEDAMIVLTTTENGESRYTLHSCFEKKKFKSEVKEYKLVNDTLYADGTVFRIDEDTMQVTDTYELNEFCATIPDCTTWNDDYYYNVESNKRLTIYDNHYNYVMTYDIPTYATSISSEAGPHFVYCSDGTVIAQYFVEQPDTEKKYDLIVDTSKYDMHSFKITPKNKKIKEIKLDMYVMHIMDKDESKENNNVYDMGKKDIGMGWPIIDERISTSYDNLKFFFINSDGKYDTSIGEYDGDNVMYNGIGNGFIIRESLKSDRLYLLNNKGEEIGAVDGVEEVTMKYLMTKNAIFDYTLTKLSDLGDYTCLETVGNGLLFSRSTTSGTDDIYIFDGSFKKIGTEDTFLDTLFYGALYAIEEEGGICCYDAAGNALFGGLDSIPTASASDFQHSIYFVSAMKDAKAVYYRVSPQS